MRRGSTKVALLCATTLLLPVSVVACSSEDTPAGPTSPPVQRDPPPDPVTVVIEHRSSTAELAGVPEPNSCEAFTAGVHIHPSWRDIWGFSTMLAVDEDLWRRELTDVPVGRSSLRVHDPRYCGSSPHGTVTAATVYANGVLLERLIDAFEGPNFVFSVDEDGNVTP